MFIDNNNISKSNLNAIKPKLIESKLQLSDLKKVQFGFDLSESVIDVPQCGYCVTSGEDILYTYGIDPCYGLVLHDKNVRILFHLDGSITPEDVIKITNNIVLSRDTTVLVIPGGSCGIDGTFEYKKLEEEYKKRGYNVIEQRIPSTFGFVTLESNKVTIGTAVDRSLDIVLPLGKEKIDIQSNPTIDELKILKAELNNNYNINVKSR